MGSGIGSEIMYTCILFYIHYDFKIVKKKVINNHEHAFFNCKILEDMANSLRMVSGMLMIISVM